MFLLKKPWRILFILFSIFGFIPKMAFSQCPNINISTNFLVSNDGFTFNASSIEVGNTLTVTANPTFSSVVKNTIKYRVGYFGSATLAVRDFSCITTPCKTNSVLNIPTETDFEIIQNPDLQINFSKPGVYYVIQSYNDGNGNGNVHCERIIVFPKPVFTYKTCNCVTVIVDVPKNAENDFYDEIDVIFSNDPPISTTPSLKIKKVDYGKQFLINRIPFVNYSGTGPCPNRGSIEVKGLKFTPIFKQSSEEPLIDFLSTNVSANGIVHWAEELKHEANGDFTFKSKEPVDILEISNDNGLNWTDLPSTNYTLARAGREFKISNVPLPPGGTLCFRGNAQSPCGNTIPEDLRPKACMTGNIQEIFAEPNLSSGNRDIIVQLDSKDQNSNAIVRVLRTSATNPEKVLTENIITPTEYSDVDPDCDQLTYRTETITSEIDPTTFVNKITKVITQSVKFKLDATGFNKIPGSSTVTVSSTGYSNNEQIVNISNAFLTSSNGTKRFNYYGETNNSGTFIKLNGLPINQTYFSDGNSKPNDNSYCYYLTIEDQCKFETPPSLPICTIKLESKSLYTVNWNQANVATDGLSGSYVQNDSYTIQEVLCSSGTCDVKDFPTTTDLFYNMDKADIDENKHFIYVRVLVNTSPEQKNNVSNILKYFFPPKLYIPTVFTPNKTDVNNNTFLVRGTHVNTFKFEIYDRWGKLVETLENINETWDGGAHPEGIYNYSAEATDFSGDPKRVLKKSGSFLLVR